MLLCPVEDCLGVSVHRVSFTTLMGVWATDSGTGDFADEPVAPFFFLQTNQIEV